MRYCKRVLSSAAVFLLLSVAADATLGQMVVLWPGKAPPKGWLFCDGSQLSSSEHAALFSAIGQTYGGNSGMFALPNLEEVDEPSLGSKTKVRYIISDGHSGTTFTEPPAGMVFFFTGNFAIRGFVFAEGQRLDKTAYPGLFDVVGSRFSGYAGSTDFPVPDLRFEIAEQTNTLNDVRPSRTRVARRYPTPVIAIRGTSPDGVEPDPSREPSMNPYTGQVVVYAGSTPPPEWAACRGQEVWIHEHSALFSLVGMEYGGDARTKLGIPNMVEKDRVLKKAAGLAESSAHLMHIIALGGSYPARF